MLKIKRYPATRNKSLQVSSAADEYLLNYISETAFGKGELFLMNDRFGYLACNLAAHRPYILLDYKSQWKALRQNCRENALDFPENRILFPLDSIDTAPDLVLIKVPKSLELFRFYLWRIHQVAKENTRIVCAFMTRHFSKQIPEIAAEFFHKTEQSLARKKARLLILEKPKKSNTVDLIAYVRWKGRRLMQYPGVFSASRVDFATRFLLENLAVDGRDRRILDLASGNGIIAWDILQRLKDQGLEAPEMHLLDDFFLAIESSRQNLKGENCIFHFDDNTDELADDYFDLVVSNPPFHFDHELNTEISRELFKGVSRILCPEGRFVIVFNRHLLGTYRRYLKAHFPKIEVLADSPKYILLEMRK